MRAVVLVGGEGTRLRPLTFDIPKQLLPVVEIHMVERVLEHLARHGVDEAVLSLGYQPDAFVDIFPDGKASGVRLSYATDPEPLDTAGAIRYAARAAGIDDTFLVVNGDVLTDADLSALFSFHGERGADATILLTPVEDPSAFGVVAADVGGRVTAFVEKPPEGSAPSNLINAGAYVLEPSVLDRIPGGRRVSVERQTFPDLAAEGRLYARAEQAYWIDAGTPATYLRACIDLVRGVRPGPPAPAARALSEGCWAIGAPVLDGTAEAPCLLADASFLATGATVRASVLAGGARVEQGGTVTGSVLLAGAVVGRGASIQDSIVGEGARVGEECVLSDLCVIGNRAEVPPATRAAGARLSR